MKRKEINKLTTYEDIKKYADILVKTTTAKPDFSKDWETFEADLDKRVIEDFRKQYQIPIPETNVRFARNASDAKPGDCFADADGDVYVKLDDGSIEKICSKETILPTKAQINQTMAINGKVHIDPTIKTASPSEILQEARTDPDWRSKWNYDPKNNRWVQKNQTATDIKTATDIAGYTAQQAIKQAAINGSWQDAYRQQVASGWVNVTNGINSSATQAQTSGWQNVQGGNSGGQQASQSPQSSQASGAHVGAWKPCIWQGRPCICQLDPRTGNYIVKDLAGTLVGYARPQDILYTDPWEDPLAAQRAKAENTIATIDLESGNWREGFEPKSKIYYHDRWPTIPSNVLVDNAIKLLKEKRNVDIKVNSKQGNILYGQDPEQFVSIIYKIRKTVSKIGAWDDETETLIEARIPERAFDRTSTDIDSKANLRGRINTNDYITLRIAYLLYIAAGKAIKEDINYTSDILTVIGHNTREVLPF